MKTSPFFVVPSEPDGGGCNYEDMGHSRQPFEAWPLLCRARSVAAPIAPIAPIACITLGLRGELGCGATCHLLLFAAVI